MNYLEIEGVNHPFKFTFSKILLLSEMHKAEYVTDSALIIQKMRFDKLPEIVLMGLQGGAEALGKACGYNDKDEIKEAFEKDQQLIGRSMQAVMNDLTSAFALPEDEEEETLPEGVGKSLDGTKYKK